ncbi:MAG: signal peptide peptidase SppA [Sphingobacteriales bacterium]|nr:signal peptide peptidase SppA [Sphingobacteriales bacterium]
MKQFFKYLFASLLGFLIGSFVLLFLIIGIVAGIASGDSEGGAVTLKDNAVLRLNLNYVIPERTLNNPFDFMSLPGLEKGKAMGLTEIIKNIKKAKDNAQIKGIYIGAEVSPNSYATLAEIRNALIDFKKSGKFIIAYAEIMDEHSYYVASVADKIYLNPTGEILLNGFSQQVVYLKGMLDKIGVEPQLIRHGKYKSAGEPFIASSMSEENRSQIESYLGSLYQQFISDIASSRKMNAITMRSIVDELQVQSAADAIKLKIIDGVKYEDEIEAELKTKLGIGETDKPNYVTMAKFNMVSGNTSVSDQKIAVLYCVGDISGGEGDDQSIGSDRMAAAIKKVREDESYKALVLRINSPGGSALASDIIWREVSLCKAKKPVIVSMGEVAASGGYYIAAPADHILAQPNTITGSIGVFGMLINAQDLLNNKLGVKIESVKFGEFADLGSPDRPLNEAERLVVQRGVDRVYDNFIERVAKGRKLSKEQVEEIAQGRVWSGIDAKKIGLVDELGGLDKAIEIAASKAKLSEYRCVHLPELKDPIQELIGSLGDQASSALLKRELGAHYIQYQEVKKAMQYQGVQVRMPFNVKID